MIVLVLALAGCETADPTPPGDSDSDAVADVDPCLPAEAATVALGTGGRDAFQAFMDGDALVLQESTDGTLGAFVEVQTTGLDTSAPVTLVYRLRVGTSPSDDWVTRIQLLCGDEGGWTQSFLELDTDPESLDGRSATLTATVTDDAGTTESGEVAVTLQVETSSE